MRTDINNPIDKMGLKLQKEIELLALIYDDYKNLSEIFLSIDTTLINKEHQSIFKALSELNQNETDHTEILHAINRNCTTDEIIKISNAAEYITNAHKRIKEFYDLSDSLKVDDMLKELSKTSLQSIKGLDTLFELRDKVEVELQKYKRFEVAKSFSDSYPEIVDRLETSKENKRIIKTPSFPTFNRITGGLIPGNLIGIAGAFKMGKTTFGLNLILDLVQKIPSAVFSLEMSKSEIENKILSHKLLINSQHLRDTSKLTDYEKKQITDYYQIASRKTEKLFLTDKMMTIKDIEREVINLKREHDIQAVMIDYIGLIKQSAKYETREQEISDYSRTLKTIAKEHDVIIIVLAQLNRMGVKEATSQNLAESLGLARDCDYLFTVANPFKMDIKRIKLSDDSPEYFTTENDFLIKLTDSRHTENAAPFLLRIDNSNRMQEVDLTLTDVGNYPI